MRHRFGDRRRCAGRGAQRAIGHAAGLLFAAAVGIFDQQLHHAAASANQLSRLRVDQGRSHRRTERQHKPDQHPAGDGVSVAQTLHDRIVIATFAPLTPTKQAEKAQPEPSVGVHFKRRKRRVFRTSRRKVFVAALPGSVKIGCRTWFCQEPCPRVPPPSSRARLVAFAVQTAGHPAVSVSKPNTQADVLPRRRDARLPSFG